jgi:hypothetical protein
VCGSQYQSEKTLSRLEIGGPTPVHEGQVVLRGGLLDDMVHLAFHAQRQIHCTWKRYNPLVRDMDLNPGMDLDPAPDPSLFSEKGWADCNNDCKIKF